jgi:hypothetical protein
VICKIVFARWNLPRMTTIILLAKIGDE